MTKEVPQISVARFPYIGGQAQCILPRNDSELVTTRGAKLIGHLTERPLHTFLWRRCPLAKVPPPAPTRETIDVGRQDITCNRWGRAADDNDAHTRTPRENWPRPIAFPLGYPLRGR